MLIPGLDTFSRGAAALGLSKNFCSSVIFCSDGLPNNICGWNELDWGFGSLLTSAFDGEAFATADALAKLEPNTGFEELGARLVAVAPNCAELAIVEAEVVNKNLSFWTIFFDGTPTLETLDRMAVVVAGWLKVNGLLGAACCSEDIRKSGFPKVDPNKLGACCGWLNTVVDLTWLLEVVSFEDWPNAVDPVTPGVDWPNEANDPGWLLETWPKTAVAPEDGPNVEDVPNWLPEAWPKIEAVPVWPMDVWPKADIWPNELWPNADELPNWPEELWPNVPNWLVLDPWPNAEVVPNWPVEAWPNAGAAWPVVEAWPNAGDANVPPKAPPICPLGLNCPVAVVEPNTGSVWELAENWFWKPGVVEKGDLFNWKGWDDCPSLPEAISKKYDHWSWTIPTRLFQTNQQLKQRKKNQD